MTPLTVFALLFVLCAVGRVLVQRKVVHESAPNTLNLVALYVCLPASVLLNGPKLVLDRSLAGLIAVPWILLALTVGVALALGKLLTLPRESLACVLMLAPLGNTSFLGYSLCPALAGPGSLKYAVVYDQFGSFVILSTYGLATVAAFGGRERPTARTMLRRMVLFPPFIALTLAITVVPSTLPPSVESALGVVAGALLPMVDLALGMQLRFALPRRDLLPLGLTVVLKLVVLPVAALALCTLFGMQGDMRKAAVLESAMPTMITAGALLTMAGVAPELAAAIVGYDTLLSALTLPLWRMVL